MEKQNEQTGSKDVAPVSAFEVQFKDAFLSLEKENLQDLSSEYKGEWADGEVQDYIVAGIETFTVTEAGEAKTKECVKVFDRSGKSFIIGATVAVNAAKKVGKFPFPCRITNKGKKQSAAGKYFDLSVQVPQSFLAANTASQNG